MNFAVRSRVVIVALAVGVAGCATTPPRAPASGPRYPDYPNPDVPAALRVDANVRRAHEEAWTRLQSGDLRGAERAFNDLVRQSPGFYPAETGLGFALLAEKQGRQAATKFSSAIGRNDRYVPAWIGQGEAQLALGNDAGALSAFERVMVLDPRRDSVRGRLDLIRFRQVQSLIEAGRKAREAGKLADARTSFERALELSPASGMILREIATVELGEGSLDAAEAHARKAIQSDASDAEALALLGKILEARGRLREAAAAYASAARIDPKSAWVERSEALKDKAVSASIPAEFKSMVSAPTATRAQVAALVGMRLEAVLARTPRHVTNVATDIKGQWAEPWILSVTQTGVMDVFPNHTFQPAETVRRSDLARIVSQVLNLLGNRQSDVAKWRATRPRFVDLPAGNIYYPSAALAVASGVMDVQDGNRFAPTRPATGADIVAAVTKLEQLAR